MSCHSNSLRQVLALDDTAVSEFFRDYRDVVYSTASAILKNTEDALDLVSDFFTELLTPRDNRPAPLSTFCEAKGKSLRSFIRERARWRALNRLEQITARNEASLRETLPGHNVSTPSSVAGDTLSALVSAEYETVLDESIQEAMNQLCERCQLLMHLYYRVSLTRLEIAYSLGSTKNKIDGEIHRCRQTLRQVLRRLLISADYGERIPGQGKRNVMPNRSGSA